MLFLSTIIDDSLKYYISFSQKRFPLFIAYSPRIDTFLFHLLSYTCKYIFCIYLFFFRTIYTCFSGINAAMSGIQHNQCS